MKVYILFSFLLFLFLIYIFLEKYTENWYATTTYVNSPFQTGVYSTMVNDWWNRPRWNYPMWNSPRWNYPIRNYPSWNTPFLNSPASQIGIGPEQMLTSLRMPRHVGRWEKAGIAYSQRGTEKCGNEKCENEECKGKVNCRNEKGNYVDVYRLNLDFDRDIYQYMVQNKYGQLIPISDRITYLDDGDTFKIVGSPELYRFIEQDRYNFVYL